MTENKIQQFIEKLAQRERISSEKVREIIISSFCKSYCQGDNKEVDLHFEFNDDLKVYRVYQIVEKVANPEKEIASNNKILKEGKVENEKFFLPVDTKNFSFLLSHEVKKNLNQNLGEVQQEKQLESFKSLPGNIIRGLVQGKDKDYYLVNLGKNFGYWAQEEWRKISSATEPIGKRLWFFIKEIQEESILSSVRLILTRKSNLFLQRILEKEIPQIKDGTIIIHHILRLPGLISKVIVESKEPGINAKGTCIGEGALRIKSISSLTYPERVEIAVWKENEKELLFELVSPVKIVKLIEKEGNNWEIIISQEKAALLLQYQGELLKKIGEYLKKNIHVRILEEIEEKK